MSEFVRFFLPSQVRIWKDLPYTVFDTRTQDLFKSAVNRWIASLSSVFSIFCPAGVCGVAQFINNFVFSTWPVLLVLIIIIIIIIIIIRWVSP